MFSHTQIHSFASNHSTKQRHTTNNMTMRTRCLLCLLPLIKQRGCRDEDGWEALECVAGLWIFQRAKKD